MLNYEKDMKKDLIKKFDIYYLKKIKFLQKRFYLSLHDIFLFYFFKKFGYFGDGNKLIIFKDLYYKHFYNSLKYFFFLKYSKFVKKKKYIYSILDYIYIFIYLYLLLNKLKQKNVKFIQNDNLNFFLKKKRYIYYLYNFFFFFFSDMALFVQVYFIKRGKIKGYQLEKNNNYLRNKFLYFILNYLNITSFCKYEEFEILYYINDKIRLNLNRGFLLFKFYFFRLLKLLVFNNLKYLGKRISLKKKKKKQEGFKIFYIYFKSTVNNVFVYIYDLYLKKMFVLTNMYYKKYFYLSLGQLGYKGPAKHGDSASYALGQFFCLFLKKKKIKNLNLILLNKPTKKYKEFIKGFFSLKTDYFKFNYIYIMPKIAHNGCRLRKKKRI